MEKNLLITVGNDPSCLQGVRFVASFFRNREELKATLFYDSAMADPRYSNDAENREMRRKRAEKHKEKGQEVLESTRHILCRKGFNEDQVECKFIFKQFGTVKDIVREGKAGLYDAVVLGRRGYHLFEKVFSVSVSREILDERIESPIWICRHIEEGRSNVLVCVDGSEPSFRAADHAGFILADQPEHSVTLLYVDIGQEGDSGKILEKAVEKVSDNGVPAERVGARVVKAGRVAPAVLEEIQREKYAAVAVGRVGLAKSAFQEWLMGSSTIKLLDGLEKTALWVSP